MALRDFYINTNPLEIDLRAEMERTLGGASDEISKQQTFILRTTRRDSDGSPIPCSCQDPLTKEPDSESGSNMCPFCLGHNFYFDESFVYGYTMYTGPKAGHSNKRVQMAPGIISAYDKVFWLRYDTVITYDDKIIELKLDSSGNPIVPYKRKLIFRPETIMEMRSDNGRIEFITIYVNENNAIRVK